MILTAIMVQLGFLAAWRTMHRLHLVLISPVLTRSRTFFSLFLGPLGDSFDLRRFSCLAGLRMSPEPAIRRVPLVCWTQLNARTPWIVVFNEAVIEAFALDVVSK